MRRRLQRDVFGDALPDPKRERQALAEALRCARELQPGPVPEGYRPPVSTFPLTPAAREGLRLTADHRRKLEGK